MLHTVSYTDRRGDRTPARSLADASLGERLGLPRVMGFPGEYSAFWRDVPAGHRFREPADLLKFLSTHASVDESTLEDAALSWIDNTNDVEAFCKAYVWGRPSGVSRDMLRKLSTHSMKEGLRTAWEYWLSISSPRTSEELLEDLTEAAEISGQPRDQVAFETIGNMVEVNHYAKAISTRGREAGEAVRHAITNKIVRPEMAGRWEESIEWHSLVPARPWEHIQASIAEAAQTRSVDLPRAPFLAITEIRDMDVYLERTYAGDPAAGCEAVADALDQGWVKDPRLQAAWEKAVARTLMPDVFRNQKDKQST